MEHKKWVILCFIGGVLMVLSSVVGSVGFIGTVLSLAAGVLGPDMTQFFSILLTILVLTHNHIINSFFNNKIKILNSLKSKIY